MQIEKARWELDKNVTSYFEKKSWKEHPIKQLYSHLPPISKPIKLDKEDMQDTAGELMMNLLVMFFYGCLHMDEPGLINQQELVYINFVWTQDAVWKTCWEQWMIGTERNRESGKPVLSVQLDDEIYLLLHK